MPARLPTRLTSMTARLVAVYVAIGALTIAVAFAALYAGLQRAVDAEARRTVIKELDGLGAAYGRSGRLGLVGAIEIRTAVNDGIVALLSDRSGRILAGNLNGWPQTIDVDQQWHREELIATADGASVDVEFRAVGLPDGSRLLVGATEALENGIRAAMLQALLVTGLILPPLLVGGGLVMARYLGRRIDRIAATAHSVTHGELAARVPVDGTHDAFDRLGETINDMLDRIEALMSEMRVVTDSLAHDLKSPVMRLKARLDRIGAGDDIAAEQVEACRAEADNLQRMLDVLLEIARAESGLASGQMEWIDLGTMLAGLAELYEPLAEDKGFRIVVDCEGRPSLRGHGELIGRALSNLLDNAIKYAVEGEIRIFARNKRGRILLGVADCGPGIAEANRDAALRRFGRLDPARGGNGAGLGLSLVAAIARLHGGRLDLLDNDPGLVAQLTLPKGN